MFLDVGLGWLKTKRARALLAAIVIAEAAAVASFVGHERVSRRADENRISYTLNPNSWWMENVARPTANPPISAVANARILPGEIVVGVVLGGKSRAYRYAAFDDASGHLVNDMVGGVPVSVACCTLTRTVRVYTDPARSQLLDAEILGLLNGQIVIRLGKHVYFHRSGQPVEPEKNPPPIPYQVINPVVATWQNWVQRHPDTDVFLGGRRQH